jgi:hypothetical protein
MAVPPSEDLVLLEVWHTFGSVGLATPTDRADR